MIFQMDSAQHKFDMLFKPKTAQIIGMNISWKSVGSTFILLYVRYTYKFTIVNYRYLGILTIFLIS